ncbi:MAG: hypothetical protein U5K54_18810 [Cytophagales bacterium]|nr:hypothetical protein [Cytophagales bacterium]
MSRPEKYYLENIESALGDGNGFGRSTFRDATFLDKLNDFKKAATEYEAAIQLFKQEKNFDFWSCLQMLIITYQKNIFKLKNFEEAHYNLKEYTLQNDTLTERQNLSSIYERRSKVSS